MPPRLPGDLGNAHPVAVCFRTVGKPFVIGHAAGAGEAPANTLAGVEACLDARAEAIEIDLQLCADGIPVLMHDETVDRTTNLKGRVRRLTVDELAEADAGQGEHVPTLDEVLELVNGQMAVFCELKATTGDERQDSRLVTAVIETIVRFGAWDWTGVHSFRRDMVREARQMETRVSAAIISPPVRGGAVDQLLGAALKRNAQAISLEHSCIQRDVVVRAKQRQLTVWAWTADQPAHWDALIEAGVDGIITNFPSRLRSYLDE